MKSWFRSGGGINGWLSDRRWKIFVLCLPALAAAATALAVFCLLLSRPAMELRTRYDITIRRALQAKNYELARVACMRSISGAKDERDRAKWIYYLALAMQGAGRPREAEALINDAAPLEPFGAGCVEAHLAVAQRLLNSTNLLDKAAVRAALANPTNALAVRLHTAERHLLSAAAIDPESLDTIEMLGRFYINTRQPEKARARLLPIYAARPEIAALLAISADAENDAPNAIQWANRAVNIFEHNLLLTAPQYRPSDRLGLLQACVILQKYSTAPKPAPKPKTPAPSDAPQDSPPVWLAIVRLLLINGKYAAALQTLEHQMAIAPDPAYRSALAEVCLVLARGTSGATIEGQAQKLRLVQEGLTNAPDDIQLQLMLVQATHETNSIGAAAKATLAKCVADATGETAAWWNFVLWTDARFHGDMTAARRYLQTAHELSPKNPLINNDRAMDLAEGSKQDLAQALDIIQAVIDKHPFEAGYRDTRGQILAKMGRNQEALADLEYSVSKLKNPAGSKRVLAKVYAALGKTYRDEPSGDLAVARSLMNEGKYAEAIQTLEKLLAADNNNPTYSAAAAEVCSAWAESLPFSQHVERLRLIEKGLARDPLNQKLHNLLLAATKSGDPSSPAAKQFLDQIIANAAGESALEWHQMLGTEALKKGDLKAARRELETAEKLDPQRTQVQIELARVLAAGSREDLERGLKLVDSASDKFPDSDNNADFRNTRGRILAGLGRNQEAEADLSFAAARLADPDDQAATRRILAQVYDAMGKPQKAEQQRRLIGLH